MQRYVIGFLIELLMWFGLVAIFLWAYVTHYAGSVDAVLPHAALSMTVWVGLVSLRLAFHRIFPAERVARMASVALMTCAFACLVAYYGAVLSGLEHWGRVISWPLMVSYAPQMISLIRTLGMSPVYTLGSMLGMLLSLLFLVRWTHRADWISRVPSRLSPAMVPILVIVGLGFSSVRLYAFSVYPPAAVGEPVSLTFFPEQEARRVQSATARIQSVAGKSTTSMDRAETKARAEYLPNPVAKKRNVILIVADALRPDHMSFNGYHRETTPYLDSLARLGKMRKAERMLAVCAESLCGLLAILQGRYVHQFPDHGFTLHEVLMRHGYRTSMILGGDHTNYYGLKERYGDVDRYLDGSQVKGYYFNDDQLVVDHVANLPNWDGVPAMMQFHLMSSHGLGTRRKSARIFEPSVNYYRITDDWKSVQSRKLGQRVTNYYDNGVRSFDSVVQDIVELLSEKGYLADAIVVITGDHGELLGEHGELSHARTLYEPVLRVPFLMMSFGEDAPKPFALGRVASQADIAPTILRELDMPLPSTWSGRALQDESIREFIHFQQGTQVGLVDLRDPESLWKYVIDVETGDEVAFDVTASTDEKTNEIGTVASGTRLDWRREATGAAASLIVE
jgi:glucan phosphoethanolaminetransferase (alkaline phosphatase superfamily)